MRVPTTPEPAPDRSTRAARQPAASGTARAAALLGGALAVLLVTVAGCASGTEPGSAVTPSGTAAGSAGTAQPGSNAPPQHGTLVSGEHWSGVLLDARLDWIQRPDEGVVHDGVTSFVPTEATARRFEEKLPTTVMTLSLPDPPDPRLPGYVRQYTGVEGDGARHLRVNGLCESAAEDMSWQHGWIEVADGGDCFWQATMDLDSGRIIRFAFNGEA